MPRTARHNKPGTVLHVISQFVDQRFFFASDDERELYFYLFARAMKESDWRCLSYAIMSNHLHHQFLVGRQPMEAWTRRVNSPFGQWINQRCDRVGPVFADRPTDLELDTQRSGQLTAYIHNNPVRAGVVQLARDSTWTSHRAYVGLVQAPAWLHVDEGLRLAGFDSRDAFDAWVNITPGERGESKLDKARRVIRRRGAIEVGTPRTSDGPLEIPLMSRRGWHVRPDPRRLVKVVTEVTGLEEALVCSRQRHPELTQARCIVVRSGRSLGLTLTELAGALGISVQGASGLARRELPPISRAATDLVTARLREETWGRQG